MFMQKVDIKKLLIMYLKMFNMYAKDVSDVCKKCSSIWINGKRLQKNVPILYGKRTKLMKQTRNKEKWRNQWNLKK